MDSISYRASLSPARSGYRTTACSQLEAGQAAGTEADRSGLGVINGLPSFSSASRNHIVDPFQEDFTQDLALLVLALGFGEGGLILGGNELYSVGDGLG